MATQPVITGAPPRATTRRMFMGGALALPALAAAPALASLPPTLGEVAVLDRELDRVIAARKALADRGSDATYDYWASDWEAVLRRIEGLPETPDAARVRAKAVLEIYEDSPLFDDEHTTDYRLTRQIIRALAAGC